MTKNQIEYWKLVELERNNRAVETETNRSNLAREAETNRSNLAREKETHRSNVEGERLTLRSILETRRSHQVNEKLARDQFNEQLVQNRAQREIAQRQVAVSEKQQSANLIDVQTRRQNVMLTANLEQQRINETKRYNKQQASIAQLQLSESTRTHKANEAISGFNAIETQRSHRQSELIQHSNLALENKRFQEAQRHNLATESETRRSDLMNERLKAVDMAVKFMGDMMKSLTSQRFLASIGGTR